MIAPISAHCAISRSRPAVRSRHRLHERRRWRLSRRDEEESMMMPEKKSLSRKQQDSQDTKPRTVSLASVRARGYCLPQSRILEIIKGDLVAWADDPCRRRQVRDNLLQLQAHVINGVTSCRPCGHDALQPLALLLSSRVRARQDDGKALHLPRQLRRARHSSAVDGAGQRSQRSKHTFQTSGLPASVVGRAQSIWPEPRRSAADSRFNQSTQRGVSTNAAFPLLPDFLFLFLLPPHPVHYFASICSLLSGSNPRLSTLPLARCSRCLSLRSSLLRPDIPRLDCGCLLCL